MIRQRVVPLRNSRPDGGAPICQFGSGDRIRTCVVRLMRPGWGQLQSTPQEKSCRPVIPTTRRTSPCGLPGLRRSERTRRPNGSKMVDPGGLEPPTPWLQTRRSSAELGTQVCRCTKVLRR